VAGKVIHSGGRWWQRQNAVHALHADVPRLARARRPHGHAPARPTDKIPRLRRQHRLTGLGQGLGRCNLGNGGPGYHILPSAKDATLWSAHSSGHTHHMAEGKQPAANANVETEQHAGVVVGRRHGNEVVEVLLSRG
jgi:hypothetical protein